MPLTYHLNSADPANLTNQHRPQRRVAGLVLACVLAVAFLSPVDGYSQTNNTTTSLDQAIDPGEPLLIIADQLNYDIEAGAVKASGNVEITNSGRRLLADEISYLTQTNEVIASGNVTLVESNGDAFFADELTLDGELANGFVRGLGVLLSDDSRMAAAQAVRRDGEVTELTDAVYTPCRTCRETDEVPIWQIRAGSVIHDQAEKTITYRHARLEIYGVPVAYSPYFAHPDPTVERRSGLLAPSAGTDSELGFTLEVPYHWVIAENRDLTFNPLFTTRGGTVLGITGRDLQEFGRTELTTSFTVTDAYQRQASDDTSNELRGHIEGRGTYQLWDKLDAGFEVHLASDNSYLQRFDFSNDDVLQNRLFVQRIDGQRYFYADAYGFQGLRDFDEQGRIPVALPWLRTRWHKTGLPLGSTLTVDGDFLVLTRTTGLDTRRFSTTANVSWDRVDNVGGLWGLDVELRGDLYHTDGNPQTLGEGDSNATGRLLPRVSATWSLPLAGQTGDWQHIVEPLASATIAVNDGNDRDIPNEDSIDFELDDTNLFEADRFVGLDRYDSGSKLTVGGRFQSTSKNGFRVDGLIGQSYRLAGDSAFGEGSGVDGRFSDYIGRFAIEPNDFFNMNYRFRLDQESLDFRRSDLRLRFGPKSARFNVGYLNLSEDVTLDEPIDREELSAGVRLRITEGLAVGFQSRIDLSENEPVAHMVGLVYTDDCFVITSGVERRFTSRGELDDTTRFALRVGLRNLGDVETDSDVLEN